MTPNEERVLKIALDAYDDETAEVAVAVLQDELLEQWEHSRQRRNLERGPFVSAQRILERLPWSMPIEHQWVISEDYGKSRRPTEAKIFAKRRWVAQAMAAYLLFRDWPRSGRAWPLVKDYLEDKC